ncbi:hypothetical protein J31TS4_44700 [Paenibacillus sp. J31TS4]|uniref:prepilin peptidase n=1 Tax=Paenibacillus sp. J31TS4 TaxID=2807195 RepID=UPI001B029971|nr:prepilin peptidase [Paenibacillus sp. J31TS4]GIP41190.1 hypothetical protein J31TS4_44700 [Paenibacillus sp. J31TS4]
MLLLIWAALGAVLGYLLELYAVYALRNREHRPLRGSRLLAILAMAIAVPLLYRAAPGLFLPNLVLLCLLTVVTLTDLMAMLILNRTLAVFAVPLILLRLWYPLEGGLLASVAGGALAFALMAAMAVLSRGQVGGGDVKLYALLGFYMGTEAVLVNLFLASVLALTGTLLLLALRKKKRSDPVSFGPYIALAGALMLLL